MSSDFQAAKRRKQEAYEAACRTPGTPEYVARQLRLNERTRVLEREAEDQKRRRRREVARASLDTQRRVIDAVLAASARAAQR